MSRFYGTFVVLVASLLLSGCATPLLIDSAAWNKQPYINIVKVPTENDKQGVAELRGRIGYGEQLTKAQSQNRKDQFFKQLEQLCEGSYQIDDVKPNWQLFPGSIVFPLPLGIRSVTVRFHCD